jgi:hypothetical protein
MASDAHRTAAVAVRRRGWTSIDTFFPGLLLSSATLVRSGATAQAGCLTGAAIGSAVGHMAGHRTIPGAAAGCAISHHQIIERRLEERRSGAAATSTAATPTATKIAAEGERQAPLFKRIASRVEVCPSQAVRRSLSPAKNAKPADDLFVASE